MVDRVGDYDRGLSCNERRGKERKGKGLFIDKDLFLVKAERHSGSEQRGSDMPTSGLKIGRN